MVQVMTNSELYRMLGEWNNQHGLCYKLTAEGYYRTLEFDSERDFVLFVQTFKPAHEHWWRNAKIER